MSARSDENDAATRQGSPLSSYEAAEAEKSNNVMLAVLSTLAVTALAAFLIAKNQDLIYRPLALGLGTALLLGVVFFPAAAWLLVFSRHYRRQVQRAVAWPTAEGELQIAQLDTYETEGVQNVVPAVRYTFEAGGVAYEGNTVRLGSSYWEVSATSREEAEAMIAGLAPGEKVVVAYDPANPRNNAISPVRHAFEGKERLFGGLFLAFVLGPLIVGLLVGWAAL